MNLYCYKMAGFENAPMLIRGRLWMHGDNLDPLIRYLAQFYQSLEYSTRRQRPQWPLWPFVRALNKIPRDRHSSANQGRYP
jgi:hypothetical protein